jgi:hypothetical protein
MAPFVRDRIAKLFANTAAKDSGPHPLKAKYARILSRSKSSSLSPPLKYEGGQCINQRQVRSRACNAQVSGAIAQ